MTRLSRALFVVAVGIALAFPASTIAHSPTPGSHSWQKVGGDPKYTPPPSKYKTTGFGDDPLVKAGVNEAIEVGWADPDNNSDSMRFLNDQNGVATVYFTNTTDVTDCNNVAGWQGCAWLISPADGEWKMWIRKSESFCEEGLVNGCLLAERVTIHEMGHVGGYFPENEGLQDNTVMQSATGAPRWYTAANGGPRDGWDHTELMRCDQARMQVEYDVDVYSGPYADCYDHVNHHGVFGMKTDLDSLNSNSFSACVGQAVTVTGRLDIRSGEFAHYGRELGNPPNGTFHLDGNPLANRVLSFTKDGNSAGTATADGTSGTNWSKSFGSAVSGIFDFTVVFDRDANTSLMRRGLDSSATRNFSITWIPQQVC